MLCRPDQTNGARHSVWQSRALQSALWLAVAGAAAILYGPAFESAFWPPRDVISDFFQDWASARNVFSGLPVYSEHKDTIPRYIGEVDPLCYCYEVNAHPPTSVTLLLPLALLDYRPALLVWNVVGLVMLGASLWIVLRCLGVSFSLRSFLPALALLLFCRPLVQQLFHGQLNLVLLLLITGAWALERSGWTGWAGALVGAAATVKLFPAFLFLYFVLRREWRALLVGLGTMIALTAITAVLLGPEAFTTYVRQVLPRLDEFRSSWFNASLVGFWTKLFNPDTLEAHVQPIWRSWPAAQVGIALSWFAVAATLAWSIRKANKRIQLDHAFGVAVTGMLLLSPITWDYAFVLLLLPLAVLSVDPPRSEAGKVMLVAAIGALWFWQKPICQMAVPGGIFEGVAQPVHTLTVLSYPCYALVIVLIIGATRAAGMTAYDR
jgi:hypothetical protein